MQTAGISIVREMFLKVPKPFVKFLKLFHWYQAVLGRYSPRTARGFCVLASMRYTITMTKYNAKELRKSDPTEEEISSLPRNPIYIVVDNVLDTYNIGSIFRLADAIAATKV